MSWDGDTDGLVSGCPPGGFYDGGISKEESARLAMEILSEERRGSTPPAPEPRPDANPHLSGPWYDGEGI
jgi:hypothetical protein